MSPRPYLLMEANYRQLQENPPQLAILPWGATEAHNYHLPYGTDVLEATALAELAADKAYAKGASIAVLPTIPFGNDQQQLDQFCTISFSTTTAQAILRDVVRSIQTQGIDRLVIVNAHGGNHFQPLVRDLQSEFDVLIIVANFYAMVPDVRRAIFDIPGDHADESETSMMMHLHPSLVELESAGSGSRVPFAIDGITEPGVWSPRPWSATHPDSGSGDPSRATGDKGQKYVEAITDALCELFVGLASAKKGQLPYV